MLNIVLSIVCALILFTGVCFLGILTRAIKVTKLELKRISAKQYLNLKDYRKIILVSVGIAIDILCMIGVTIFVFFLWI